MKVLHLSIMVLFFLSLTNASSYADSIGPLKILDVKTQPDPVKVNDTISLDVTLLDNSTYPVYLTSGPCTSAFSVEFDYHVNKVYPHIICTMMAMLQKVDSQSQVTISNADKPRIIYQAVEAGITNANITLSYSAKNLTATDNSNIYYTTSKSFQFQILDNSIKTPKSSALMSPLQQIRSGIASNDVKCASGLQLVIKLEDSSPACVSSQTAQILIERGWGQAPSTGVSVMLGEGQREGPLLVQKVLKDSIEGLNFREYPLATNVGVPVTLHIGDTVTNGCTVEMSLVKIDNHTAIFLKKEFHNRPCPICLSEDTLIDTPNGQVKIKDLKVGTSVFTQDDSGKRKIVTILKTGKTIAPPDHKMVHLVLKDGRELYVSQNHPTADGRLFGNLMQGDIIDGSKIKNTELVSYNGTYTYDILPSGSTGFYWANGILAGSTLK